MNTLPFSRLYSHPNKALEKHLTNTAQIATMNLIQSPIRSFDLCCKEILGEILLGACLCHDIGKSTEYFQQYLMSEKTKKEKMRNKEETKHSLLSAVSTFYVVQTQLKDLIIEGDERLFMSFIAFMIVRRHHGNLANVLDEVLISQKQEQTLKNQVNSIDKDKLLDLGKHLKIAGLKQDITVRMLKTWMKTIKKDLIKIRRMLRSLHKKENLNYYLITNYLFSLLIDADKNEVVIGTKLERKNIVLDSSIIDKYKQSHNFEKTYINILREKAYQEVLNKPINLEKRIYSINLPTGLGKTFTSYAFALDLRDKIKEEKGFTPRIIYSLPFLSIIEQNSERLEEIIMHNNIKLDTDLILKHHHLSDIYYKKDNDEFTQDEAKILIEGWNSEIIITTFVQLFHTIVSYKNKTTRRFHQLAGSIIILDEVQSIPFKYWLLVNKLLKKICEEMDSYVIFVTATEPLIFDKDETISLVDRKHYFEAMDRVVIRPQINKDLTLEEFSDSINIRDDKSYLFIFNTIKSAKKFYNIIKDKINDEIAFLTTHVTPFERLQRIEKMRLGNIKYGITTQLVEAGVDIDFDIVYRDIAPIDSINQAAGRCNRNWDNKEEKGEVIVISLKDEQRLFASYIYDGVMIDITKKMLSAKKEISENEFLNVIETYYLEMQKRKSSQVSKDLIEAVYKLKYDSADEEVCIKDFKLIANDYPKFDIFIEINERAKETWQKYLEIRKIENLFERRLAFNEIKTDFYSFTISVPVMIDNVPPEVDGFRYVNLNSLNEYYDKTSGFKCRGVTAIW